MSGSVGGTIDATAKGYASSQGPGASASYAGGYGGNGGPTNIGGNSYGSITEPTDLGSGGANNGANGGGSIKLNITGTLTNNGSILANGSSVGNSGSGGSVWINTNTLAGNGNINANGGNGSYGGGGGRIALYYQSKTLTGSVSASGGVNLNNGSGGAGTVYEKDTNDAVLVNGNLRIDNGNIGGSSSFPTTTVNSTSLSLTTLDNLIVTNKANVVLNKDLTILNTTFDVNTGTNFYQNNLLAFSNNLNAVTLSGYWESKSSPTNISQAVLNVQNGGYLTTSPNTTLAANENYKLDLTFTNLTIDVGGTIDATAKGYASSQGPGASASYAGGYGGNGGPTNIGGNSYGSITEPTDLGSGGANNGANGGGSIKLNITGTLTNNGSILANGSSVGNSGSGGSVWINTNTLAGNGNINANGGNGSYGGGGGRIALYYQSKTLTGSVSASGGVNLNNGSGGAGTVYEKDTNDAVLVNGNLRIDNGNIGGSSSFPTTTVNSTSLSLTTLDNLIVTNKANVVLNKDLTILNTTFDVNTGTNFYQNNLLAFSNNLNAVTLSGYWESKSSPTNISQAVLNVQNGGYLTTSPNTTLAANENYKLDLTFTNLTIDVGGTIDATAKGYASSQGPGASASYAGGYGGNGGPTNIGGNSYGSITEPTDLGSGGANNGANGGGSIKLNITGTLTNNGSILANGSSVGNSGSGGSVWINTNTLAGNGNINANGGNGSYGGGGGRIALYYQSKTLTGSVSASGGVNLNNGSGGAGTVYSKQITPAGIPIPSTGSLIIRNSVVGAGTKLSCSPTVSNMPCFTGNYSVDSVVIEKASTASVTHLPNSNTQTNYIDIETNTFSIDNQSSINLNGLGYSGNNAGVGNGPGGGNVVSGVGSGAGFGNNGGDSNNGAIGGIAYGSNIAPDQIGSAGGGANGGNGGGYFKLRANTSITLNGNITTNATNGTGTSGGGSGGSIWLFSPTIAGTGNLVSNGGNGISGGGCGAGGRIAFLADNLTGYTGTQTVNAGTGAGDCVNLSGTVYTSSTRTPITNSNISSVTCTPTTTNINTNVNCTVTTTVDLNTLSGSVNIRIGTSGTVVNCPIPSNSTGTTLTCNDIPVGATDGTFPSQYNASGSGTTYLDGNNINVVIPPLTSADISSLVVTCGVGGVLGTATVNSTTTCTFTLPTNKTLPSDFKLGVSDATPAGTCTVTNTTTQEVTCIAVPTGTLTGNQPINGQIGNGAVIPTTSTVTVNRLISNGDISTVVCTTPKLINQTSDCVVTLTGTTTFSNLTGDIKIQISDGLNTPCPAFPTAGNTLTCTLTPVGTLIGTFKPNYSLNNNTAINTGSSDVVVNNPIQNTDIQSLSCSPTSVPADTSVDCTITLSGTNTFNNFTGSIDFRIGTAGTIKNCTIPATGNTLTCTGISVGSTAGILTSQYKASGTVSTYANGNDITVNPANTPLTTADIPALTVVCGGGNSVSVNSLTTCDFILPVNKTLPTDFTLKIGSTINTGPTPAVVQTCSLTVGGPANQVVCEFVQTGSASGNMPIYGVLGVGANSTQTDTGEIVLVTDSACSTTNPCALFETALTYSPTQALAKRYGASGSTNSDNLILTLKDTRLEQSGFTTTCSIKYKFRTDTSYRTLTTNSTYNNTTGCTGNLLKANQLLFNVDFEITAITTNTTTNTTKNYLIYSNYDFKAGSIGVTSIGGSGL